MGLEDFTPSEGIDSSPKSAEISEKIKEGIKKGASGIKRVQKDEKKAKKYDQMLAFILTNIVKQKEYDFIHSEIFFLLNKGFSSSVIIGIISLIYKEAEIEIRKISGKEIINFNHKKFSQEINFSDEILTDDLKNNINYWIENIFDISTINSSTIQIKNTIKLFKSSDYDLLLGFGINIFNFYFQNLNVKINNQLNKSYISFIFGELLKKLNQLKLDKI
ncbi:MAG: hypothetical protein NWP80_00275 [Candidatus Gracilibacteria bacterium]|nr:hypothetical protein [Candidatus Gracilibacteria bacterium]